MGESTLIQTGNYSLMLVNALLAVITLQDINIIVAIMGALMTVVANLDKVVVSIVRIQEIRRNGWRITPPQVAPPSPSKPDDNNG